MPQIGDPLTMDKKVVNHLFSCKTHRTPSSQMKVFLGSISSAANLSCRGRSSKKACFGGSFRIQIAWGGKSCWFNPLYFLLEWPLTVNCPLGSSGQRLSSLPSKAPFVLASRHLETQDTLFFPIIWASQKSYVPVALITIPSNHLMHSYLFQTCHVKKIK